jgi:hypothetical protein
MKSLLALVIVGVLGAACGDVRNSSDPTPDLPDATTLGGDADVIADAGPDQPDAEPPVQPGPPSTDLSSGAARVSGATYTMDVQLGLGVDQSTVAGPNTTLQSAAAVAR